MGNTILHRKLFLPGLLGIVLLGGIAATYQGGTAADRERRTALTERATAAAAAIEPSVITSLSGTDADLANPEYVRLKELLVRLRQAAPDVRFVYILREMNERPILLCDSEPAESADYSPPGQVYEEAIHVFRAAMAVGKPTAVGPYSDRWGTWVTGIAPFLDANGRPIAALGCDINAEDWAYAVILRCLPPAFICLLLLALLALFSVMYSREQRTVESLRQREAWVRALCETTPIDDESGGGNGRMTRADSASMRIWSGPALSQEAFLNSIIERNPHAMWISDDTGTLLRMNQACRDLLHVTDTEMVGKYNALQDNVVEEQGAMPLVKSVFEKGGTVTFPLRYDSRKLEGLTLGERVSLVLDVTISPVLDAEGKITNAIIQLHDVTRRWQAEEALRKSVDQMQMMLKNMLNAFVVWESVFDEKGDYVSFRFGYFNDAYSLISGLKFEDVHGKDVFEVWPSTERSWVEIYGAVARTGVPKTFEMHHSPTNGFYHCNAYRPWDSPDHVCVIFEDIAQRKSAEDERRRLEEQLAQAQKIESVGRLAGGIAHDFNNILAVILGHGELLMADLPADSPIRESLAEIMAAGNRAKDMTRQLLAFSRKQVLEVKPLDLNAVVHGIEKMLRRLLGEDIEIKVLVTLAIGRVNADPTQLEQAIMNLCVNARDAMPDGGTLTIETGAAYLDEDYAAAHPGVQAGRYVLLSVSDTGTGMDAETQRQIFDPFFTTKEIGKGTGLGLATVYGIVKQHGGSISVYSEIGHGSTFRIYLPQIENPASEEPMEAETRSVPGSGEVILLMEDDTAVRKVATEMLSHLGYSVIEACDIEECIERARGAERLDLFLTDVIMPGINGRQAYERIDGIRPGIKALFMSGYTDDAIAHHGILGNGVHFLSKPFTERSLSLKIREALSS